MSHQKNMILSRIYEGVVAWRIEGGGVDIPLQLKLSIRCIANWTFLDGLKLDKNPSSLSYDER